MKLKFDKNHGITLIALVITIVILLVLVGIIISMLTGQNEILSRTSEAKNNTEETQIEEKINLAISAMKIEYWQSNKNQTMKEFIYSNEQLFKKYFGEEDAILNYRDGTIRYHNKTYLVNLDGNIKKTNFDSYTWDEINQLAKAISNDININNTTESVTKTIAGKTYTAVVGDVKKIEIDNKAYTIRILGFNHDTLSNEQESNSYGEETLTGKAGITFEFATLLSEEVMNDKKINYGGWKESLIRKKLNNTSKIDGEINISNIEESIGKNIIKSYFCYVNFAGNCYIGEADSKGGIAPCFSV